MTRGAHAGNRVRRGISNASARAFSVENHFFLHDWEIDNHIRRMELARKKLFSYQQENKQLCRRNRKLARSLEMFKKVSALKRISRRLKKSWSANNEKIRKKIKQIKQKNSEQEQEQIYNH